MAEVVRKHPNASAPTYQRASQISQQMRNHLSQTEVAPLESTLQNSSFDHIIAAMLK